MKYTLRPYQKKCVDDCINFITSKRKVKKGVVVLPTGCHEKGYKVYKSNGELVPVEDVKVGDFLLGINGTRREVLNLCRGKGRMYKINVPRKGFSFIVNDEHILHLLRAGNTNVFKDEIINVSVKDYLNWSKSRKDRYRLYRPEVSFPDGTNDLPIDPYILGVWLGDGGITHKDFTIGDKELLEYLIEYCNENGYDYSSSFHDKNNCYRFRIKKHLDDGKINSFTHELNKLIPEEKVIPQIYLSSSKENRLKLLAGLIDTDGYNNGEKTIEISQKNKELSYQIYRLANSLGLSAYIRLSNKCVTVNGKIVCNDYYRITFILTNELSSYIKVKRKSIINRTTTKGRKNLIKFDVEYVGEDDFYGFTLDGDHLYIDEHNLVVHNSGKSLVISDIAHKYNSELGLGKIVVLQPSKEILKQNYEKYCQYSDNAAIYSASMDSREFGEVTFATLGSVKGLGKTFKSKGVTMLCVDESHLNSSPKSGMMKNFIKDLDPACILGFTATPFRLNSKTDLSTGYHYSCLEMLNRMKPRMFNEIVHVLQIQELVNQGYWAKVNTHNEYFDPIDLQLNSSGAEFTEDSVALAVKKNGVNNRIYKLLKGIYKKTDDSVLCFLDNVENCYIMKDALNKHFGYVSDVIEAKTKKDVRDEVLDNFKNKQGLRVILCVATLTTGFDFPELEVVIMGRPTNSLAVYYQIYGRGVRPHKNKVANFYDFGGNMNRFGDMVDLTIEYYNDYGWGVFLKDRLLSEIPMDGRIVTKKDLDKVEPNPDEVFTFGKYKGVALCEVPPYYLRWALENLNNIPASLKKAIRGRL